jgi:psp operon transcriptional activator
LPPRTLPAHALNLDESAIPGARAPEIAALIGQSAEFLALLEHVSLAAALNRPVLLIGERGTGKELIAARLHYLSKRWDRPLIKLNCAALAESLLETELFGYEPGAFTGATKKHAGRFELAHTGTLFLDELATMSPRVQEKLLRILEYGEFERVGGRETLRVDVRVIGATNADLPALAARGEFRPDLLDRLAFDVITLPPLRARLSDIVPLAEHYATRMTRELKRDFFAGFSHAAQASLTAYAWPGNVRELKNVAERAVYRNPEPNEAIDVLSFDPFASVYSIALAATTESVVAAPLGSVPGTATREPTVIEWQGTQDEKVQLSVPQKNIDSIGLEQEVQDLELKRLTEALNATRFNQRKAAELLKLSYHQLRGYLRKYKIGADE